MCSAGEDSCLLTETTLFAKSAKLASERQGRSCCEDEGCGAPGHSHEVSPLEQMEFWGTEVTPGKPQINEPGDDTYVHVSQAALGPSKDGKSERVVVRVESGGKDVVLGTLSTGKVDQMTLDLIFDREFKLSHTSTSSSVFFCGYRTDKRQEYDDESDDEDEDEDEEEEDEDDGPIPLAVPIKENGTVSAKEAKGAKKQVKVIEQVLEAKVKKVQSPKASLVDEEAEEGEGSEEDDDEDDDDEDVEKTMKMDFDLDGSDDEDDSEFEIDGLSGSEDESDEEDDSDVEGDLDDDDEDEDDEDDVAPELGKKRGLQGSAKRPTFEGKKPRLDTPAKPGLITTPGKKVAKGAVETKITPVSTKKSEAKGTVAKTPQKTPAKETTAKTPKTDKGTTPGATESAKKLGAHTCAECNRGFATESALSQHAVAKHKK